MFRQSRIIMHPRLRRGRHLTAAHVSGWCTDRMFYFKLSPGDLITQEVLVPGVSRAEQGGACRPECTRKSFIRRTDDLLYISWQRSCSSCLPFVIFTLLLIKSSLSLSLSLPPSDLYPCIKDPATHTKSRGLMSLPLICSASRPLMRRAKGPSPMFTHSPPHALLQLLSKVQRQTSLSRSLSLFISVFLSLFFISFLSLSLWPLFLYSLFLFLLLIHSFFLTLSISLYTFLSLALSLYLYLYLSLSLSLSLSVSLSLSTCFLNKLSSRFLTSGNWCGFD